MHLGSVDSLASLYMSIVILSPPTSVSVFCIVVVVVKHFYDLK